jgi:hypothetical protein
MSIAFPQWVVQDWVDQQQREWGPRLTALDPGLRLIPPFQNPPDPAMAENRWHIARFNEVRGQHVLIPIAGPNGEFREMDEAMFEALKRADRHSNRSSQQVDRALHDAHQHRRQRDLLVHAVALHGDLGRTLREPAHDH